MGNNDIMLGDVLAAHPGVSRLSSHLGGSNNTPGCFMLQKPVKLRPCGVPVACVPRNVTLQGSI